MPAIFSKFTQTALRLPSCFLTFKRLSHGRPIFRRSALSVWYRTKDHMHFYLMLAVIFWGGIAWGITTVVGPCELRDIPEGYEPRFWEYERHPIQQLLCRLSDSPESQYEYKLGKIYHANNKQNWQREELRVRRLMHERQDYRAYYYVPYSTKWLDYCKQKNEYQRLYEPDFTRQMR